MANMLMGIISLTIGIVVVANVFIRTIIDTNQTYNCPNASGAMVESCSWGSAEVALWGLISLVGVFGMIFGVLNVFGLN